MKRTAFLALLLAFLLAACGGGGDGEDAPLSIAEARQLWSVVGPRDYRFTVRESCFCAPEGPITVVVRNGAVASATYADGGQAVSPERLAYLPTIDDLFDLVEDAQAHDAAEVRFVANSAYGYPEQIYIDYDHQMADEEVGYEVSDFAPGG